MRKTTRRTPPAGGDGWGGFSRGVAPARYCQALSPAGAILAAEILVGFGDVGDAHGGTVVRDFSSGTQRDHAEEHDFRELGGV